MTAIFKCAHVQGDHLKSETYQSWLLLFLSQGSSTSCYVASVHLLQTLKKGLLSASICFAKADIPGMWTPLGCCSHLSLWLCVNPCLDGRSKYIFETLLRRTHVLVSFFLKIKYNYGTVFCILTKAPFWKLHPFKVQNSTTRILHGHNLTYFKEVTLE